MNSGKCVYEDKALNGQAGSHVTNEFLGLV